MSKNTDNTTVEDATTDATTEEATAAEIEAVETEVETAADATTDDTEEAVADEPKPISKRRYVRGRKERDDYFLEGTYHAGDLRNNSALFNAMERKSETPKHITQIMRHMTVPRNHPNYLPFNKAVAEVMGEVEAKELPNIRAQVMQASFNFIRDLTHGHDHDMYRIEREDNGQPIGGRYRARRPEAIRNWEQSRNEHRRALRAEIGAAPKGRIHPDLQTKFDEGMARWNEDNPQPAEDDE